MRNSKKKGQPCMANTCKILISLLRRFCDFARFFFVMHLIATM